MNQKQVEPVTPIVLDEPYEPFEPAEDIEPEDSTENWMIDENDLVYEDHVVFPPHEEEILVEAEYDPAQGWNDQEFELDQGWDDEEEFEHFEMGESDQEPEEMDLSGPSADESDD